MKDIEILLPHDSALVDPSKDLVMRFTSGVSLGAGDKERLGLVCSEILRVAVAEENPNAARMQSKVRVHKEEEGVILEVINLGPPLFMSESRTRELENKGVEFENLGRKGQRLVFRIGKFNSQTKLVDAKGAPLSSAEDKDGIRIRELKPGEESQLSALFFEVYRYHYVNEYVYYPEKLRKMIQEERLIPIVAENAQKKIVGHIGLVRWNDNPPVYEAALGVVDPKLSSGGLFTKIFDRVVLRMEQTAMQYCVYDFVTNHDFSQRMVAKYGFSDLALLVGNQDSSLQAKLEELGIGKDPKEMDRYSLLVAVGPRVKHPFGTELILPTNIGESFGFLLKGLSLNWTPAPRFYPLAHGGDYSVKLQPEHQAAIFDLHQPGKQALTKLLEEWKGFLREGYIYGAIDVPIHHPGLGQVYDLVSKAGFFMAGFLPYQFSKQLCFRFQFLLPSKVNFAALKLHSETGKRLLAVVKENYERNQIL